MCSWNSFFGPKQIIVCEHCTFDLYTGCLYCMRYLVTAGSCQHNAEYQVYAADTVVGSVYVCSVACWLSQVHWLLELHVALSLAALLQVFRLSLTEYSMSWTRYRLDIAARDRHLRQLALTGCTSAAPQAVVLNSCAGKA
jgi:hypothetical protein